MITEAEKSCVNEGQVEASQFLLEEYRNIASTHDNLREVGAKIIHFGLILSAFPWTMFALTLSKVEFQFIKPPLFLSLTLIIVGFGVYGLSFSLLDSRLGQYRYARTVNLIRKYYSDRFQQIQEYLYLPTSKQFPEPNNLGYVSFLLTFFLAVGSLYVAYGIFGLINQICANSELIGVLIAIIVFLFGKFFHKKLKDNQIQHYPS